MPAVIARLAEPESEFAYRLRLVCSELVPAAFTCIDPDGDLWPGQIRYFTEPFRPNDHCPVDAFIHVQAKAFPSRVANLDDRVEWLLHGLRQVMPQHSFDVWPLLGKFGWATDVPDPEPNRTTNMSMRAAAMRAQLALVELDRATRTPSAIGRVSLMDIGQHGPDSSS